MKKLNEELFPGDLIEIESKVYKCIPAIDCCDDCALNSKLNCSKLGIGCSKQDVILVKPQVFKPTLLVVGESIEILGVKLLIKKEIISCSKCILFCNKEKDYTTNPLCKQVDCETNECIISNEIVLWYIYYFNHYVQV